MRDHNSYKTIKEILQSLPPNEKRECSFRILAMELDNYPGRADGRIEPCGKIKVLMQVIGSDVYTTAEETFLTDPRHIWKIFRMLRSVGIKDETIIPRDLPRICAGKIGRAIFDLDVLQESGQNAVVRFVSDDHPRITISMHDSGSQTRA